MTPTDELIATLRALAAKLGRHPGAAAATEAADRLASFSAPVGEWETTAVWRKHVAKSLDAILPLVLAGAGDWRPVTDEAKTGARVLLWVCSRGSVRRGIAQIGWWGHHRDFGQTWLLRPDHPIDADAVRFWKPIEEPGARAALAQINTLIGEQTRPVPIDIGPAGERVEYLIEQGPGGEVTTREIAESKGTDTDTKGTNHDQP